MRILVLLLTLFVSAGALAAAPGPCLLKAAELAPVLGHVPLDGKADIDPLGNPMCVYGMKDDVGHRFLLRVERSPWDRKRYDQRLSLARGSGIREVVLLKDVGDAGFFVEGAAGALAGTRYIEISGFKAAALRPVQVDEAASLLKLIIERLPKQ
jgi:hypothetical protein